MPVDKYAILEIVIRQLVHHGFPRITITLGHLGHLIVAVIGDGSRWGAEVDYTWEDEPRGTVGAVHQVRGLTEPFLVMNGDLLTDFDFRKFLDAHRDSRVELSIGVYLKQVPVSLGVLELDEGDRIVGFREKSLVSFPCSMGIYAFTPELLRLIPSAGVFGFDDLIARCLAQRVSMRAHLFNGLWLDIGRHEDYASATELFAQNRARLFPGMASPDGVVRAA
jgi:mannose-1-phosphate guanylyltransferase